MTEYYLYPIFDAPWVHHTPNFITLAHCVCKVFQMLFVHYFSNLQFHQKGSSLTDPQKFPLFICLFGDLRRFQHSTGHITTGSWKGRGNQYI